MKTFLMGAIASAAMLVGGAAVAAPARAAVAKPLQVSVYNPGAKGIFPVSSEIVVGPHEVLLVDAQFLKSDAQALVARIKATGKPLTTVYISQSDPDYYFGLETIKAAFPNARIVATPGTVAAIEASRAGKLAFWGPQMKADAPTATIVPEVLSGDTLTVDGTPIKIVGLTGPAPDRTFLWIAANKAVVGGIPVFANVHPWIADTQTPASRANWQKSLDAIVALKPAMVVPGHFLPNAGGGQPLTLAAVRFTKDYLTAFEAEAAKAKNSAELIAAMKRRYPALGEVNSLELSAKVIKGEMKWPAG